MRKSFIIAAVLVAALTSCQKELQEIREGGEGVVRATREAPADTKSTIANDGAFAWSVKDAIAVYNSKGAWARYATSEGGSASANFTYKDGDLGDAAGYAVSPYALDPKFADEVLSVTLPAEYDWVEDQASVPMLAVADAGVNQFYFKNLGGVVRFTFKGVPAGEGSFTFWTDKAISGEFEVDRTGESPVIKAGVKSGDNKVTIKFDNETAGKDMNFYVPVPVGTYESFSYTIKCGTGDDAIDATENLNDKTREITRAKFLRMKAVVLGASASTSAATVTVSETYEAATTIALPSTSSDVNVVFEKPQTNEITITYNNLLEGEKPANVNIYAGENTIDNLKIELEESTVTLLDGTYATITAKTAENTLVVNEGVIVTGTLTVTKGNLEFNGQTTITATGVVIDDSESESSVTVGATGYIKALTVTKGDEVNVLGTVGTLTATSATKVTVADGANVTDLSLGATCSTVEIAGTVATIGGTGSPTIVVKTTGRVNAGTTPSGGAVVYVETDGENSGYYQPGGSKTLNLNGLQAKINEELGKSSTSYTLDADYSESEVIISKDFTITTTGHSVFGKFVVKSGATLTLNGTGTLKNDEGNVIEVEKGGKVIINGAGTFTGDIQNAGTLDIDAGTFKGTVNNEGTLDIAAGTTFTDAVIVEKDENAELTVATNVALPEVVEADGSKTAYVTDASAFKTAIGAQNLDQSFKFSKVVVNNTISDLGGSAAVDIKGTATAVRDFELELRADVTANSNYDAFDIRYANVTISADATERTIAGGSSHNALVLSNNAAAAKANANKTTVTLGKNVKLTGANGIKIAADSFGVEVNVEEGANCGNIEVVGDAACTSADAAPVINLKEGSTAGKITSTNYAVWNINNATIANADGDAITLVKGDMTIGGTADKMSVTAGTSNNAVNVTGGTDAVELAINGGEIGKITVANNGAKTVKDFIYGGTFTDVSAANLGAEGKTVNIKLAAATSSALTVNDTKSVALDLNGQNISGAITVKLGGKLVIDDTAKASAATVSNTLTNNGTATLNGGTYGLLVNHGELMTINKGVKEVTSDKSGAEELVLNGYKTTYSSAYDEDTNAAAPKLVINGGKFKVTSNVTEIVKNAAGGVLEINGGTFSTSLTSGVCIDNVHVATISGGDFTASGSSSYAVKSVGVADATYYGKADANQKGEITLSGTVFKGQLLGPATGEYGKIAIEGGEYSVDPTKYVDAKTYKVNHVPSSEGVAERWTVSK